MTGKTLEYRLKEYHEHLGSASIPSTLVAHQDDIPIGCVSLIYDDMETEEKFNPWAASLYVDHKYRGRGIANILIKALEDFARKISISELYLFCSPQLISFYKKYGCEVVYEKEWHGVNQMVMRMIWL